MIEKHFYKENEPYQRNWQPLDSFQCINSPICLVFFNIFSISNINGVNVSGLKNVTLDNESFRFLEISLQHCNSKYEGKNNKTNYNRQGAVIGR